MFQLIRAVRSFTLATHLCIIIMYLFQGSISGKYTAMLARGRERIPESLSLCDEPVSSENILLLSENSGRCSKYNLLNLSLLML